jgi:hypothetical protein
MTPMPKKFFILLFLGSQISTSLSLNIPTIQKATLTNQLIASKKWLTNPACRKKIVIGSTAAITALILLYNRGSILHRLYNQIHSKNVDYGCHKCEHGESHYICATGFEICDECYSKGLLRCLRLCPTCFCRCYPSGTSGGQLTTEFDFNIPAQNPHDHYNPSHRYKKTTIPIAIALDNEVYMLPNYWIQNSFISLYCQQAKEFDIHRILNCEPTLISRYQHTGLVYTCRPWATWIAKLYISLGLMRPVSENTLSDCLPMGI